MMIRKLNDQLTFRIKELENENERLRMKTVENNKHLQERKQEINLLLIENEGLQNQIDNVSSQYGKTLDENVKLKNEVFEAKQELIDLRQQKMNSNLTAEKLTREIHQLKEIVRKTELFSEVNRGFLTQT